MSSDKTNCIGVDDAYSTYSSLFVYKYTPTLVTSSIYFLIAYYNSSTVPSDLK